MVKPPTVRSTIPGVGRLGLVEPSAPAELAALGWVNADSVELLWSLSRAANADLALRTLVRIKDGLGTEGWAELDAALRVDTGLRGRLFGVIGASSALGDHLASDPGQWTSLRGNVVLPTKQELVDELLAAVEAVPDGSASPTNLVYRA